jgi:hypothetical protein
LGGRAAERLGLSQPRVSRLISALEREADGALFDAIIPPLTPSGLHETLAPVASGQVVHPTAIGLPLAQRSDITLLPLTGLPPLKLGLIWCTARENARIRALAGIAATLTRPHDPGARQTDGTRSLPRP